MMTFDFVFHLSRYCFVNQFDTKKNWLFVKKNDCFHSLVIRNRMRCLGLHSIFATSIVILFINTRSDNKSNDKNRRKSNYSIKRSSLRSPFATEPVHNRYSIVVLTVTDGLIITFSKFIRIWNCCRFACIIMRRCESLQFSCRTSGSRERNCTHETEKKEENSQQSNSSIC